MSRYFNVKDFANIQVNESVSFSDSIRASADGKKAKYDVFISHSSEDKALIKKLRQLLEDRFSLSAYIDWDEDAGMARDEVAETVKDAMTRCGSFLIVKTSNSDKSSWVSWETGIYDAKAPDKIGVLLIENEDKNFTKATFVHQEYLKRYELLMDDEVVAFVRGGAKLLLENRKQRTEAFNNQFKSGAIGVDRNTGTLASVVVGTGKTTKFYGDKK